MDSLTTTVLLWAGLHAPECRGRPSFEGPGPGESIAVAASTGRWVRVAVPAAPIEIFGAVDAPDVLAYELVVFVATQPDPDRPMSWGLLAPGDTVLAVPWGVDEACRAVPVHASSWVPAGGELVVRATTARIHDGRRVLDVVEPFNGFPYLTHIPGDVDAPETSDPSTWLSPFDYFRLIAVAPRPGLRASRAEQLRRLEEAYRSGPMSLLDRFPGPQMLEASRAWARGGDAAPALFGAYGRRVRLNR